MNKKDEYTWVQNIGIWIVMIPLVICGMEMVPGWGFMGLNWNPVWFYLVAGMTGMVGGAMVAKEEWFAGLVAGPFVSIGALFATALVLQNVKATNNLVLTLVGMIGAIPGFLLYYGIVHGRKKLLDT